MNTNAIIVGAIGLGLGIAIGHFLWPSAPSTPSARPGVDNRAPVARIAGDFRSACRDLDPLMSHLERSFSDRDLSLSEAAELIRRVRGLT